MSESHKPPFVDAHAHLIDGRLDYPWLAEGAGSEAVAGARSPDDHRAETVGWNLIGTVHVEAGVRRDQAVDETRWLDGLAGRQALPDIIVAQARLESPDIAHRLAEQAAFARVRGIRQLTNRRLAGPDLMDRAAWRHGFALLADHGLSFDLHCDGDQLSATAPILARCPGVPVVIDHLGLPGGDRDGMAPWSKGMAALAALPHVAVKLSGLGFVRADWTIDDVRPVILKTVDLFGPDRCMIASNLPTDRLFAPFDRSMEAFDTILADFSADERRAMFGGTANRFYRMDLPAYRGVSA